MSSNPYRLVIAIATQGLRREYLSQAIASALVDAEQDVHVVLVGPAGCIEEIDANFSHISFLEAKSEVPAADKLNMALSFSVSLAPAFAFLSDDDLVYIKEFLQMTESLECQGTSFVFGDCNYIDAEGALVGANKLGPLASIMFRYLPQRVAQPATVFRTSDALQVGGFNSAFSYAYDFDFYLRLTKLGGLSYHKGVVAAWRAHGGSATKMNRWKSSSEASRARKLARTSLVNFYLFIPEKILIAVTVGLGLIFDAFLAGGLRQTDRKKRIFRRG